MTTYTTVLDGYDELTLWRSTGPDDPRPLALATLSGGKTRVTIAHEEDHGVVFRAAAVVLAPDEAVVALIAEWLSLHDGTFVFDGNDHGTAPDDYREQARELLDALRDHVEEAP